MQLQGQHGYANPFWLPLIFALMENPKILKIAITCELPDGSQEIQTLEGEEAEKWHEWSTGLAIFADIHGANPDWESLKWKTERIKAPQRLFVG